MSSTNCSMRLTRPSCCRVRRCRLGLLRTGVLSPLGDSAPTSCSCFCVSAGRMSWMGGRSTVGSLGGRGRRNRRWSDRRAGGAAVRVRRPRFAEPAGRLDRLRSRQRGGFDGLRAAEASTCVCGMESGAEAAAGAADCRRRGSGGYGRGLAAEQRSRQADNRQRRPGLLSRVSFGVLAQTAIGRRMKNARAFPGSLVKSIVPS